MCFGTVTVLGALFQFGAQAATSEICPGHPPDEKKIRVILDHPTVTKPELDIPVSYFGGLLPGPVERTRKGGLQSRVWLAIEYPSMCPSRISPSDNVPSPSEIGLDIHAARIPYLARFWAEQLERFYAATGHVEFGLDVFERGPYPRELRKIKETVYFFQGNSETPMVNIYCPDGNVKFVRCTAYIEVEPNLAGTISFPIALLREWRGIVRRAYDFIDGLRASAKTAD